MSPTAILLILVAAIAHASWNLFGKQAAATGAAFFIWLLASWVTVGCLPVAVIGTLVIGPHLTGANWVFLAGTGVLHSGYFLFLQLGYRIGDLSAAYPVSRGSGALLAAAAGIVLLGERPTPVGAAGIAAIIAGVLVIGLPSGPAVAGQAVEGQSVEGQSVADPAVADPAVADPAVTGPAVTGQAAAWTAPAGALSATARGIAFAVVTGMFIACYTVWDKYAVSSLHTPPLLQGLAGFPLMVIVFAPFALRDRRRLAAVWRSFRPQVLGAAALSPLAYILVLVALSFTAVSAVAPAREISVLFGVLLGRRLLGEGHLVRRLAAAAAIVAGIVAVAVA